MCLGKNVIYIGLNMLKIILFFKRTKIRKSLDGNFAHAFSNFYTRKEDIQEKSLHTYTSGKRTMFDTGQLLWVHPECCQMIRNSMLMFCNEALQILHPIWGVPLVPVVGPSEDLRHKTLNQNARHLYALPDSQEGKLEGKDERRLLVIPF